MERAEAAMEGGGPREKTQLRYARVQQHLRARIAAGEWGPGAAIPPETELAQQFGVARMTVRQALDGLRREGPLTRARGHGDRMRFRVALVSSCSRARAGAAPSSPPRGSSAS